MMPRNNDPELYSLGKRLSNARGPEFWQRLEQLAGTEAFHDYVARAYPAQAARWGDACSRRRFLKLMGASLAMAGLEGCVNQPEEKIVPYVQAPESIVPGRPLYFATTMSIGDAAIGLLVESHMGRPTKVEGNPLYPAVPEAMREANDRLPGDRLRFGATNAFAQASVLSLYDPDRSQVVKHRGQIDSWEQFLTELQPRMDGQRGRRGAGLRILTGTITSPTLAAQLDKLLDAYPEARWHQYEPIHGDLAAAGSRMAFGEHLAAHYRCDRARTILSLDADFLAEGADHLRQAHDWAVRRRDVSAMGRLYAIETTPTLTAAAADHRLPLRSGEVTAFALAVSARLGLDVPSPDPAEISHVPPAWLEAVVDDLEQSRGESLVIAGRSQPAAVQALAHAINDRLENVGETVFYTAPSAARPVDQTQSLRELIEAMGAGEVEVLVVLGGNPVFTAPVDLQFSQALARVPFRVHLSLDENETSAECDWHLPEAHFLESWSDARGTDGTASIVQPLIAPLYQGRTSHDLLSAMLGRAGTSSYDAVRDYWAGWHGKQFPAEAFEPFWLTALHDGIIRGTESEPQRPSIRRELYEQLRPPAAGERSLSEDQVEVVFRPDPSIWDGRFANNAWLQELPNPFTKLTWDNAALVSPTTADRLKIRSGQLVELVHGEYTLTLPVLTLDVHPDDSMTLHLGHGRTRCGSVGEGVGFNTYRLRTAGDPWFASGVRVRPLDATYRLATTQEHHRMEGRHLVRHGTLDELREHPEHPAFVHPGHEPPAVSLYPEVEYDGYKWGMVVNLNTCVGCNACVVACQAENNVPVVGKEEVLRGREMHWLRIDSYFNGETFHQPVMCMHCEKAPCEVVCPVAATTHSSEGLNEMTYNRCVGTRYCSNNCPYKVRRFNFYKYTRPLETHPSLQLLQNPDVTVRSGGVMEKCTYCVQRISAARIEAEKENRPIRDGEILTACQAACPTGAITFGDLNDPGSRVAALATDPLNYGLLSELNTRPRTTYLAAVRNPNPAIASREGHADD